MKSPHLFFILLFGLVTPSCMLGPKKEVPSVAIPGDYTQKLPEEKESQATIDLASWWKQFEDPLLMEFIEESTKKNFDILTTLEQINELRASMVVATSKLFPTLGLFGFPARLKLSEDLIPVIPATPLTMTPQAIFPKIRNFFAVGFDAFWELDFFGKNRSNKEEAYYNWLSSQENAKYTKLVVIAEVVRMYTEIRSFQQRLLVTRKKINTFEKLLNLTLDLKESGLNNDIDVEKQIASLNEAKSQEPNLNKALQQGICNLAFLLGGELSHYQEKLSKPSRMPQAVGKVPVGLPSELLQRRPDIKKAQFDLYAAGAGIGSAKAALFPSISLTGVIGNSAQSMNHLFKRQNRLWAIVPNIDWSLFQGGKLLAQLSIANSEQKIAAIGYEKTVLNALKEVENSLIGYFESSLAAEDILAKYQAQKKILKLSKCLFESGLENLLSVLNAYEELFAVQEKHIETTEETMTNLIGLYKSLGGGLE